jgi:DNA-directed RNA polymerase specialized sigma24 family protein
MSSHILIQDPSNLSTRFGNSDKLGYEDPEELSELVTQSLTPDFEKSASTPMEFSLIEKYLDRIPEREADLIERYFKHGMKQEQIARLFGITQAAVSYRLHRGIKRIQFLRTIPELNESDFETDLYPYFSDQDREILWRMYLTTCQSEVAKQMGLTQGRVRHRFFRSLAQMKIMIADEVKNTMTHCESEENETDTHDEDEDLVLNHESTTALSDIGGESVVDLIKKSVFAKYWTVFFSISDKRFCILREVSLPQFKNRGDSTVIPG